MKRSIDALFNESQEKNAQGTWKRMGVLMALLLAAGLLLWRQTPAGTPQGTSGRAALEPSASQPAAVTPAPTAARTARETAYDKDVAALQTLIAKAEASEALRAQAAEQLSQMVLNHQTELGLEEALHKAGFDACFVLMQNGALTVRLNMESLTAADSAAILALCLAHSEVAPENIRIMGQE